MSYSLHLCSCSGTAAVTVAGLLSAAKISKQKMSEMTYLFFGSGEAGTGIAEMCVKQMESEGMEPKDAQSRIYLMDRKGLVTKKRYSGFIFVMSIVSSDELNTRHVAFAKDMEPQKDLVKILKEIRPSVLIGSSTVGGAFTEQVIKTMGEINKQPIIFALSNPTANAECTAEQAYQWTDVGFVLRLPSLDISRVVFCLHLEAHSIMSP